MLQKNINNYLYHGIVDWLNLNNPTMQNKLCLEKLASILGTRYIYRPCDFAKYEIKHNDTANPYTKYFTFLACSPNSPFATRFKKDFLDDNGYLVATTYAQYGLLFDSKILDELPIYKNSFCDKEILIEDNISLDKYGVGMYANCTNLDNETFLKIKNLITKYNYDYNIYSIFDGTLITTLNEEKVRIQKLSLKL